MVTQYTYSLLQYRGDPVRREALNVGVAVVGATGEVAVVVDPSAHRRIRALWPSVDRRAFQAFVRDLGHLLADEHQLMLGEVVHTTASSSTLAALSTFAANQFAISEPAAYSAISAGEAAERLFRRFVDANVRAEPKDRYTTRAALRTMIGTVLEGWAAAQSVRVEVTQREIIDGQITSHMADLVTYIDGHPEMVFFATPLHGETATLIRDALPTIVRDLHRKSPKVEYFAVLADRDVDQTDPNNPATIARMLLRDVNGLNVVGYDQLRAEFSIQSDAGFELRRAV